jgi:hypothetical protein
MARKGRSRPRKSEPLPPPLPPETRTVGQLVAETLRLYGRRFWASVVLGLGPAATAVGLTFIPGWWRLAFVLTAGSLLMTAAFIRGVVIASDTALTRHSLAVALLVGYLIFLPVPFLWSAFILPAVAWLGLVGLAVPAAIIERLELRDAIRRGLALARADYVHAIGSLATLVILSFLTATMLFLLLRGGSEIALSSAAFASLLVISPILFLGGGLLYFDQAARVESGGPRPRRSRDADLHHAVEPHRPGRADAEGEPRPAARGEP